MNKWITSMLLVLSPIVLFGQVVNNMDSDPGDDYWQIELSDLSNVHEVNPPEDPVGYINHSYTTDAIEGSGALQINYGVHNVEAWGGYSKLYHLVGESIVDSPISGVWKLAPEAGALQVGPTAGSGEWWSNTLEDVTTRACVFDDQYVFNADGSFQNVHGEETWLEVWQGVASDQCGAPVAPHDGSSAATWEFDAGTGELTLTGLGAYLALPKAVNAGQLPDVDVPESVTYSVTLDGNMMTVVIEAGTGLFWTFKLAQEVQVDSPISGVWKLAPEAGALQVGPTAGSGEWWSNTLEDVTTRACVFDDQYVFNADGSFQNVHGEETWLEVWQGVASDQCGAPVAPHDGSNAATWEYDDASGELTLTGLGAYLALPKAVNAGQLPDVDVPESVTYSVTLDGNMMTVVIEAGTGLFWTFKLVSTQATFTTTNPTIVPLNSLLDFWPDENEGVWDWSAYDSLTFSYYVASPASISDRVTFRLNINDYGSVEDPANYDGAGEYWYSFWDILDSEPGWNTVSIALDGPIDAAQVQDNQFHMTGWVPGPGNQEFDKHAIGGMHFEFSIGGSGDPNMTDGVDGTDWVSGSIIFDDFKLTGSLNALSNPGFELPDEQDDDMGWGMAMGDGTGHVQVVNDPALSHSGESHLSIGVLDNWAVYYTEDPIPAQFGETWSLSGFAKQVLGDNISDAGAAFKLEGKNAEGTVVGTTGDIWLPLTDEWERHSIEFVMPEGTETVTAVIVSSRWDGVEVGYAFDDLLLISLGVLDVIPPVAVGGIGGVPADYYNLVTWEDIEGEEGETYNVYASTLPFTDTTDITHPSVDVVATNVLEGAGAAVHYLFYPLDDVNVTYYYAVACKDASNNVGPVGVSVASITNIAKGVPTVSLSPPSSFVADGDLSEWYDSGIQPFMLGAQENSYGTPNVGMGTVDDNNDLHGTFYVAMNNDSLYIAAEILDNVVDAVGSGGWWTADVVQICIGLYDQRGPKHIGMERGEEPDYKIYFNPAGANSDNGAGVLASHGDGNYFHEIYNPDYVFEFRISLDDIVIDDDARLTPTNGMRIPFEPMIHDNDGDGWEGQLTLSSSNDDMAHQTCEVWSNTWIGNQATILRNDEDIVVNEFALHQNYPNPFNPETTIKFSIPNKQDVDLSVYNMLGQRVVTLFNGELQGGNHIAKWHAGNIASGVYIYKLSSSNKTITQKMLLLK